MVVARGDSGNGRAIVLESGSGSDSDDSDNSV